MLKIKKLACKTITVIYLILILTINPMASEVQDLPLIEMTTKNPSLKVGEPLILELKYVYETPRFVTGTNEIKQSLDHGDVSLLLYIKNSSGEVTKKSIFKPSFICQDKKGLVYSSYSALLQNNSGNKKLLFNEPGEYIITLYAPDQEKLKELLGDKAPKPLFVNVGPASQSIKKALSILSEENDIRILEYSDNDFFKKDIEVISRFKQVVDQCQDTIIAQIAASQLGITYFKEFHEKHPFFETFRTEYKTGNMKEPLFEQSQKYLTIGSQLPDEFPIRREVIFQLSRIEFMEDNLNKMVSLINELAEKYPNTEYGKKAITAQKEELPKLKAEIESQKKQVAQSSTKKPLGVALPIAGATVAVIVIGAVIMFLRKKNPKKSE
jgi:hypothetical protein